MANLTLVQAINLALIQEMERDDRIIILGEDVGLNGGVFRVTEGLHKRFGDAEHPWRSQSGHRCCMQPAWRGPANIARKIDLRYLPAQEQVHAG